MNGFQVKKNCFAYDPVRRKCRALNDLYCSYENCKFYKTDKERCKGCEDSRSMIDCETCRRERLR